MPAKRSLSLALALLMVAAVPAQALGFPTITVVDSIRPGSDWSTFTWSSAAFNGYLYSYADDGVHGAELWRSNGETTELVADINLNNGGADSSSPSNFAVFGSYLYFSADDGVNGSELWRTNGTGAELVQDIQPGSSGSNPTQLTVIGDWLYFTADDGTHGFELWRTNGTTASMVYDINTDGANGSMPGPLAVLGDWIYFSADDQVNGVELWRTNGTTTAMVADINPTPAVTADPSSYPTGFTALGSYLYFSAYDGTNGNELWRTNGTSTTMVMNIDVTPNAAESSNPTHITKYGNALYFKANDGIHGAELWTTDGTNTELVQDWDLWSAGAEGSYPSNLIVFNNALYFEATDGTVGYEVLKYDGTSISLVHDSNPTTDGYMEYPVVVGDALYFQTVPDAYYTIARIDTEDQFTSAELPGTNPFIACMCSAPIVAVGGRVFAAYNSDEMGAEFLYLDESTYHLPATNGEQQPLSSALVLLAALTAAASVAVRKRESLRRH